MMTNTGERELAKGAGAGSASRFAVALIAAAVGAVGGATVALNLNVSWGTPGVAQTQAVTLRGNSDSHLGFPSRLISWSAVVPVRRATPPVVSCPEQPFADAAGALPSTCKDSISPGQ